MITEDYVSFESAKLLKEKGFDEPFFFYYRTDDEVKNIHHALVTKPLSYNQKYIDDEVVAAPTLQTAVKWLREVHKIYIEIHLCIDGRCSTFQIASLKDDVVDAWDDAFMPNNISIEDLRFNTYQEAEEAAVKHCLENLI